MSWASSSKPAMGICSWGKCQGWLVSDFDLNVLWTYDGRRVVSPRLLYASLGIERAPFSTLATDQERFAEEDDV
jgi:hypothetical protein